MCAAPPCGTSGRHSHAGPEGPAPHLQNCNLSTLPLQPVGADGAFVSFNRCNARFLPPFDVSCSNDCTVSSNCSLPVIHKTLSSRPSPGFMGSDGHASPMHTSVVVSSLSMASIFTVCPTSRCARESPSS